MWAMRLDSMSCVLCSKELVTAKLAQSALPVLCCACGVHVPVWSHADRRQIDAQQVVEKRSAALG